MPSQQAKNKMTVQLYYYALLREQRGCCKEKIDTKAKMLKELYIELKAKYNFTLNINQLRVAVNDEFKSWDTIIRCGDQITFIPPVAGG